MWESEPSKKRSVRMYQWKPNFGSKGVKHGQEKVLHPQVQHVQELIVITFPC